MTRFTKSDIEFHSGGVAVNVKVHDFGKGAKNRDPLGALVEEFGCSEEKAQEALNWAWESQCEIFWEDINLMAQFYLSSTFGGNLKCYSNGRSGGWLTVNVGRYPLANREDVEGWDAIKVSAWGRFSNGLKKEVEYLTSWDQVHDLISVNEWCKEDVPVS